MCVLVLASGLAGGCAAVSEVAGLPHPGHQSSGGYVLLASEQQLDCRGLSEQVELGLKDMQSARADMKAEREALPKTLFSAYGRMFGGADGGLKSATRYRKSETRVRALNGQLATRGCHSIDVDARVMAFDLAPLNVAAKDKPGASAKQPAVAAVKAEPPRSSTPSLQDDIEALTSISPAALKY